MQIELTQDVDKCSFAFIGEVSYRDEEKVKIYQDIFKNAKTEFDLRRHLERQNLEAAPINEFCKTLKKLHVIDEHGNIPEQPLIGEYGNYKIDFLYSEKDTPYRGLPIKLERNLQEANSNDEHQEPEDLYNLFRASQKLVASKAVGIIHKIDSPKTKFIWDKERINIDIDSEKAEWILRTKDNQFRIPKEKQISFKNLFKDELIKENNSYFLRCPLEKAKGQGLEALKSFNCSFSELIKNEWGEFKADYKNVKIIPRKDEVQSWYKEIFDRTLKINGYKSQADLRFDWEEILRDSPTLQRDEYKNQIEPFDYEKLIERYPTNKEEYWLLQAATDLYPYKQTSKDQTSKDLTNHICIPAKENAQINDILNEWRSLNSARRILIIDQYANTYHSIQTLDELFNKKSIPAEKITIVASANHDEEDVNRNRQKFISSFQSKHNVEFILKEKPQLPHDRYWILDEEAFTVGISPNTIWVRKDNIHIKDQINIFSINDEKLPKIVTKIINELRSKNVSN